jgi:hypothetical protein
MNKKINRNFMRDLKGIKMMIMDLEWILKMNLAINKENRIFETNKIIKH